MLALALGVIVTLLGIWLAANHEAGQSIVVIGAGVLTPLGFLPAQIVAACALFVVGFAFIHSLLDTPVEWRYVGPDTEPTKPDPLSMKDVRRILDEGRRR